MLDQNTLALLAQFGISQAGAEAALSAMVVLTILSVVAAIPTAILAKKKRRWVAGWIVFALSIPLIPLLLVWLLPTRPDKTGN